MPADPDKELKKSYEWRALLAAFWRLARPYWTSEEWPAAWGLLALVVGLSLGSVYLTVQFNTWNRLFYDALQKFDLEAFWTLQLRFCLLAVFWILAGVLGRYLTRVLQVRWRRWMTRRLLDQWLGDKSHYLWTLEDTLTDNPDQRIAEDVDDFVEQSLTLSVDLLSQIVTFFSFIAILWALSGSQDIPLPGGRSVTVPGYMAIACLLYAGVGTWLSHRVGKPLVGINFRQQRCEADFRFGLVRLRENGESVALSEGEAVEKQGLNGLFKGVYDNFLALARKQMHLNFFTSGYGQIAIIFPMLVVAPRYFAKAIGLGVVMQVSDAFGNVKDSLSWIVDNYATLASWSSVVVRLQGFEAEVERTKRMRATALAVLGDSPDPGQVQLQDLGLSLPGRDLPLTAPMNVVFAEGHSVLVSGPSGSGKSTLFRALRGLWPFTTGRVLLPAGASIMVLPQKPYLPLGSLRRALTYPNPADSVEAARLLEVMDLVRLGHLKPQLDVEDHWGLILSVGEQQRVAWVRVFLQRPQWLFLDEATSALDEDTQEGIYRAMKDHLPGSTMVSVEHAHHPLEHHPRVWEFGKAPQGLS